jgi:hypothetical protein
MSEEMKHPNPCDLYLPKDYEDDLDYRQPKPIISSTETSDDEERHPHPLMFPHLTTLFLLNHLRFYKILSIWQIRLPEVIPSK